MALKTALIVDDSKLARVTLKKKLESLGLVVDMVESAEQAYASLQAVRPDILFMDHLMPDIDGFQATQHIRSVLGFPDLPIVMCTGKDHDGYLDEALAIGANNILSKPPVDEALADILSSYQAMESAVADEAPAESVEDDFDEVLQVVGDEVAAAAVAAAQEPAVQGMSREELQWLLEHAMATTHEAVLREVKDMIPAPVPVAALPDVDALLARAKTDIIAAVKQEITAQIKADVTADVLRNLPKTEELISDNSNALDMESVLSTVNAAVNHQLAVNSSTLKTAVIEQVQAQLATIAQQQVKQAMEQDIQRTVNTQLGAVVNESLVAVQQKMAALEAEIQQCKQPKVSSSGPASEEFSRAQNDSIQQEQAVMREQLKRAQLLTYAALAVAAVALIAGFI